MLQVTNLSVGKGLLSFFQFVIKNKIYGNGDFKHLMMKVDEDRIFGMSTNGHHAYCFEVKNDANNHVAFACYSELSKAFPPRAEQYELSLIKVDKNTVMLVPDESHLIAPSVEVFIKNIFSLCKVSTSISNDIINLLDISKKSFAKHRVHSTNLQTLLCVRGDGQGLASFSKGYMDTICIFVEDVLGGRIEEICLANPPRKGVKYDNALLVAGAPVLASYESVKCYAMIMPLNEG